MPDIPDPNALPEPTPWRFSVSDLMRGVLERDWYMCVRCGQPIMDGNRSIHHRVLGNRSVNEPWNLISLCGTGTTGCHGWVHGIKVAGYPPPSRNNITTGGYIVSRHHRHPWLIPVLYSQPLRLGRMSLGDDLSLTPAA